jgi:ABC-type molybdate transport system substrate-binding protein
LQRSGICHHPLGFRGPSSPRDIGECQAHILDDAVPHAKRIVGTFPENSHAPIVYPAALTHDVKPGTKSLLDFLSGPEARAIFEKDGFIVLGAKP